MISKLFLVLALVASGVAAAYFWNSDLDLPLFETAVVAVLSLIMADVRPGPTERARGPARS